MDDSHVVCSLPAPQPLVPVAALSNKLESYIVVFRDVMMDDTQHGPFTDLQEAQAYAVWLKARHGNMAYHHAWVETIARPDPQWLD